MIESKTPINRIIIVGNGFDLSLGLKTSYTDFIFSYMKRCALDGIGMSNNSNLDFNTILLNFKRKMGVMGTPSIINGIIGRIEASQNFQSLIEILKQGYDIEPTNTFTKAITLDVLELGWVDIEEIYFKEVTRIFKRIIKLEENVDMKSFKEELKKINASLNQLTEELNSYIFKELNTQNQIDYSKYEPFFKKLFAPNLNGPNVKFLVLNFNYTDTFKRLARFFLPNMLNANEVDIVNIHGSVNDANNPIIFGYGNDTNYIYEAMEEHGERELRRHIKSFYYPNTNNYKSLLGFIESGEFDVHLVGHSCGQSDKTLLSTIFEHEDCKEIKNYHYYGMEEDFNKRLEISRHFKDKKDMRKKLADFDITAQIPQIKDSK